MFAIESACISCLCLFLEVPALILLSGEILQQFILDSKIHFAPGLGRKTALKKKYLTDYSISYEFNYMHWDANGDFFLKGGILVC